jgi:hypothetical protein
MSNYLVCCEHREVEAAAVSNENEDENQMDEMIANIGRDYELDLKEHPAVISAEVLHSHCHLR